MNINKILSIINRSKNILVFLDQDGVLAEYAPDTKKRMYDEHFFLHRPPINKGISLAKELYNIFEDKLYVITKAPEPDKNGDLSEYAELEKRQWLNKYLPEISSENILVQHNYKESKASYVLRKLPQLNFSEYDLVILIDDFGHNLRSWVADGLDNFTSLKVVSDFNRDNNLDIDVETDLFTIDLRED